MKLDLFNSLINNAKENNIVQNFIKELGEYLEKIQSGRNQKSILQKNEGKITTSYRDKMHIERNNILNEYV